MTEYMLSSLAGVLLGTIFYGGLWWTVLKGVSASQPALWFSISFLLRGGIALAGFYFLSGADWQRLLLCLTGFIAARIIVTRLTASTMVKEANHAP